MNNFKDYPFVSVVMITYAHEAFIKQAIESVLMQEYCGTIELIIANDKSPDTTDSIIKKIIKAHPNGNWISYTNHKKNLGVMPNFAWSLKQAKYKYIAICEGDDYWTDPLKLQKQVDFLEKNNQFVLVGHNRIIVNETDVEISLNLIKKIDFFTQCLLFRNVLKDDFLSFNSQDVTNGDTFLMLYLQEFGDKKLMDFYGAAYRVCNVGVWSEKNIDQKFNLSAKSLAAMKFFFKKYKYQSAYKKVNSYIVNNLILYAGRLKQEKRIKESFTYYFKFLFSIIKYRQFSLYNLKVAIMYFF